MPDAFADSTILLQTLVRKVMTEANPAKYDQLAADIRRVLDERERLREITPKSRRKPSA
jgi:hypothetical protein